MTELKPCPFCGSKNIGDTGLWRHVITCHQCGAKSAPFSSWDNAVNAWNNRPLSPKQKHADELFSGLQHVLHQLYFASRGFEGATIDAAMLEKIIDNIKSEELYAVFP